MSGLYLLGCTITLRLGTQIHCATAALIVLVALAVRFLPKMMEESPPDPPPDAPFHNTGSASDSHGDGTLFLVLGAVFLICVLVVFAAH